MAQKPRKPTTGGVIVGSDYDAARTRKMNAEAEISELELAKIRGTLCMTDDVVTAWEGVLQAVKAKFLALPSKISPTLATETDTAKTKEFLEQHIRECLAELANYKPEVDPTSVSGGAAKKATPAKRKVGRPRKTAALKK
jgi:hypothetical protein